MSEPGAMSTRRELGACAGAGAAPWSPSTACSRWRWRGGGALRRGSGVGGRPDPGLDGRAVAGALRARPAGTNPHATYIRSVSRPSPAPPRALLGHRLGPPLLGVARRDLVAVEAPLPPERRPTPVPSCYDLVPRGRLVRGRRRYDDSAGGSPRRLDRDAGGRRVDATEAPVPPTPSRSGRHVAQVGRARGAGTAPPSGLHAPAPAAQFGLIDTVRGHLDRQPAPQPAAAATNQQVFVSAVSCPARGPCAAAGLFNGERQGTGRSS